MVNLKSLLNQTIYIFFMKKNLILLLALLSSGIAFSQTLTGEDASRKIPGSISVSYRKNSASPSFVKLSSGAPVSQKTFDSWIRTSLQLNDDHGFRKTKTETDKLGYQHHTFQYYYKGYPIEGSIYKVHEKNGKIDLVNGSVNLVPSGNYAVTLSEKDALKKALQNIHAQKYMWQDERSENQLKSISNNNNATYYPKGKLVLLKVSQNNFVMAYKFDVFASQPLQRYYVYVDAANGAVVKKTNRIRSCAGHHHHHCEHLDGIEENNMVQANSTGTANTRYSGTQTITTDSYLGSYRLRETSRGNGVETYNMNNSTDYVDAVDFTDSDNNWTSSTDDVAIDAHWGAEVTYDYYSTVHSRNSFDDLGMKMTSYVHYGSAYDNAFWNGTSMTYGDGSNTTGGFKPLPALDVVGHELTHGMTEYMAGLEYESESGALNESFSDIFGTVIEFYKKPGTANFLVGEQVMFSGGALRSMSDPNLYDQPDTYQGDMWDPLEEVHTNSGVGNFWFYILAQGKSGTNDNGSGYNVTGIGMTKAADIAYRVLSAYLTPFSNYEDARNASIYAATDLYGACSPEVQAVTNAWYAVGVGNAYVAGVTADFSADITSSCTIPTEVSFTNLSNNGDSYSWDFGDGNTSTSTNPTHSYAANGSYTVTLQVDGGACGVNDSEIKNNYIVVNTSGTCPVTIPVTGNGPTQVACNGILRDNGGTSNYTSYVDGVITIAPTGASSVTLSFSEFEFEDGYDFLYIYDGPDINSNLIGAYTGSDLPEGGTITSTGGSITLSQSTDQLLNFLGFTCTWACSTPTSVPAVNFSASPLLSCDGSVYFTDLSTQGPTSWQWNFGDGQTSTDQNPTHVYAASGNYTVTLISCNGFGCGTILTRTNYITVNLGSNACSIINMPESGTVTVTGCSGTIYDSGGTSNYDNSTDGVLIIKPTGAVSVTLTFTSFNFENGWDYLNIYDGQTTSANEIGEYSGINLPEGGTITSTGNAITLNQYTDDSETRPGFICTWTCSTTVGTNDASADNMNTIIYPNPATSELNLLYTFHGYQNLTVRMYNVLGTQVFEDKGGFMNEYKHTLSVKDFAKGIYSISFTGENGASKTSTVVIE